MIKRSCQAIGFRAGMVWANRYEEGDTSVPFGGQKPSGDGADRGLRGLAEFTALKTTYIEIEGAS